MLKVNLSNGESHHFDLREDEDARRWHDLARDSSFQRDITALTIVLNGVQYSLPRPAGFDPIFLFAELVEPEPERRIKGGERILAHAGEVGIVLMAHAEQRAVRVNVTRQGKQRYNPLAK